ncbi:hypothetical protein LIER_12431 [Lithospermum erythrorhizon]|uniref:Reverse transcriptase RNase H-like domain-containing protein n=1 Tax=Lithospermum erythrorhizon TaxID=34254 RepID=A0AAV3PRQ3_LITER
MPGVNKEKTTPRHQRGICLGSLVRCNVRGIEAILGISQTFNKAVGGEELQLYIAVSESSETGSSETHIISICPLHVLHGPEENYPFIDKFVIALAILARKLKAYFEAHPIKVRTDQPIKRIMSNSAQSGRLTTWAIELSEFDINYAPAQGLRLRGKTGSSSNMPCGFPSKQPTMRLSRVRDTPAYEEGSVMRVMDKKEDWMSLIARFIMTGELPNNGAEARKVKSWSYKFQMVEGELYKRSYLGPLLFCIAKQNIDQVLYEVYEG